MDEDKKAIELTDQELEDIGLLNDGASGRVQEAIQAMRRYPQQLDWITVFHLNCLNTYNVHRGANAPTSPTLPTSSGATNVESDPVSSFEKVHFYHGISADPPELLYRSDLETNPFAVIRKGRFSSLPVKTVYGAQDPALVPIWCSTVAPAIVALLQEQDRGIRLSTLMAVRFSTPDYNDEDGPDVFGPTVIWISVHPNTTTANACRAATPDILHLLEAHGVRGAVVQWYEGAVERLAGPPMMGVEDYTDPTAYVRRALMPVLGLPLAAQDMQDDGAEGALAFFFHEGEDADGRPSARVFGVTNRHVLRTSASADYARAHNPAYKVYVRVCGARRFQALVNETRALIATKVCEAGRLPEEIAEQEAKLAAEGADQAEEQAEDDEHLERLKRELEYAAEDVVELSRFIRDVNAHWSDALQRTIGWVDWAPRVRKDVDSRGYTLDIATVELQKYKWKKEFKGNVVYLGGKHLRGKYSWHDITRLFWPETTKSRGLKYPRDDLLRIQGHVPPERLANPEFQDERGTAAFTVAKHGPSSDLTFGRYSALEAYVCDESGCGSWELAIFNHSRQMGSFAAKGDSGSLVFNAQGEMVAVLHSGMPRGPFSHVTFATLAHFVIEQIKQRYPKADFSRHEF